LAGVEVDVGQKKRRNKKRELQKGSKPAESAIQVPVKVTRIEELRLAKQPENHRLAIPVDPKKVDPQRLRKNFVKTDVTFPKYAGENTKAHRAVYMHPRITNGHPIVVGRANPSIPIAANYKAPRFDHHKEKQGVVLDRILVAGSFVGRSLLFPFRIVSWIVREVHRAFSYDFRI
jgi:hypothetical protein